MDHGRDEVTRALAAWRQAQNVSYRALLEAVRGFTAAADELQRAAQEAEKVLGTAQALRLLEEVHEDLSSWERASVGRYGLLALIEALEIDGQIMVVGDLYLDSPNAQVGDPLDLGEAVRAGEEGLAQLAKHVPELRPADALDLVRAIGELERLILNRAGQVRKTLAAKTVQIKEE